MSAKSILYLHYSHYMCFDLNLQLEFRTNVKKEEPYQIDCSLLICIVYIDYSELKSRFQSPFIPFDRQRAFRPISINFCEIEFPLMLYPSAHHIQSKSIFFLLDFRYKNQILFLQYFEIINKTDPLFCLPCLFPQPGLSIFFFFLLNLNNLPFFLIKFLFLQLQCIFLLPRYSRNFLFFLVNIFQSQLPQLGICFVILSNF